MGLDNETESFWTRSSFGIYCANYIRPGNFTMVVLLYIKKVSIYIGSLRLVGIFSAISCIALKEVNYYVSVCLLVFPLVGFHQFGLVCILCLEVSLVGAA